MSFVTSKFDSIVSKCIRAYAKEKQVPDQEAQLMFCLSSQGGAWKDSYKMCIRYKPADEYSIKQVLGVKHVDFSGFSIALPPQITKVLLGLCSENNIEPGSVTALAVLIGDEVSLHLYNGNAHVKTVDLEEIFSETV